MNKPSGSERLIFVGGCPRSGTTLVQNMLDSHPDVFGGPEFLHLQDIIQLRKKLKRSISVGWIDLFCSHEELDRHLRTLVQNLFLPLSDERQCTYLSEKSPMNILVFSELIDLFPEAHFIHIIRDPRAIVSSMQDVRMRAKQKQVDIPSYTTSISSCIDFTRKCFKAGFSSLEKFPEKILTVPYEHLVSNPEKESKKICKFLGIDWNDQMLMPQNRKHLGEKAITSNSGEIWYDVKTYYQEPHNKNIKKWKKRLTPLQQVKITMAFTNCEELRKFGYDFSLNNIPLTKRFIFKGILVIVDCLRIFYTHFLKLGRRVLRKILR